MTHPTGQLALDSILLGIALAVQFPAGVVSADDLDPVLEQSRLRVEPIELQRDVDGAWSPAALIEQPVLRFEERSRNNSGGSVWLWSETGRPAAVMELYQPADKPEDWCFVINNIFQPQIFCITLFYLLCYFSGRARVLMVAN